MDNFNLYSVQMDAECLHQDFDDVDLYGTKLESTDDNGFGDDLVLE